jgi:FixJ family two-component response regulator
MRFGLTVDEAPGGRVCGLLPKTWLASRMSGSVRSGRWTAVLQTRQAQVVRKKNSPFICIVDEDDSLRQRLDSLFRSTGARTSMFDSSESFLRSYHTRKISCLILDAHMTGVNGLQLQRMLADAHIPIPIVFVTAAADVIRAQAYAHGAVAVVRKPFTDKELLRAVTTALIPSERD